MTTLLFWRRKKNTIPINMMFNSILSFIIASLTTNLLISLLTKLNYIIHDTIFQIPDYLFTSTVCILIFVASFFMMTQSMVSQFMALDQSIQNISQNEFYYQIPELRLNELNQIAFKVHLLITNLQQHKIIEHETEKTTIEMIEYTSQELSTPIHRLITQLEQLTLNSIQNEEQYAQCLQEMYNEVIQLRTTMNTIKV